MGGSLALYWIKVLNVLAIFHIIDICPKYAMLILTENTGNFANYADSELELANINESSKLLNKEIKEMLKDFTETKTSDENIVFITPSRFDFLSGDNND